MESIYDAQQAVVAERGKMAAGKMPAHTHANSPPQVPVAAVELAPKEKALACSV